MKRKIFFFSIVLLLMIAAVAGWFFMTFQMPTVKIEGVSVDFRSLEEVDLSVKAEIHNTLKIPVFCVNANYDVFAESEKIAHGTISLQKRAASDGRISFDMPIKLDVAPFMAKRKQDRKKVPISVFGNVGMDIKIAKFSLPFFVSREVEVGKRPFHLVVKGVNVTAISPGVVALLLRIQLFNETNQEISNVEASYRVSAREEEIVAGEMKLEKLQSHGTGNVELPLAVEWKKFKKMKQENLGVPVPISIEGEVCAVFAQKKLELPFRVTKEVVFKEKPIEVKVKRIKIEKLRLKGSTCKVLLEVKNDTGLDIKNLAVDGKINVSKDVEVEVQIGRASCRERV